MIPSKYKRKKNSKIHPKPFYSGFIMILLGTLLILIENDLDGIATFWASLFLISLGFILFLYGCRDVHHEADAEGFIIRCDTSKSKIDEN